MSHTVVGMFDSASEAKQAVEQLLSHGFSPADIDNSSAASHVDRENTGSATSSYKSEDTGSGIGKFFRNLFGDNEESSTKYTGVAEKAESIVTVYAVSDEEARRAADILDDNGAVDIDERALQYGYGTDAVSSATGDGSYGFGTGSDEKNSLSGGYVAPDMPSAAEQKSIPIIEESLEIGKRTVQTGGARLRSRIIEKPVEESVRLREERVIVERNPVDRVASEKDFDTFKEGTIELTETAEVPVVSKTARVVEEISLNKEVNQREEVISDSVRKTEVDIEDIEASKKDLRSNNNDRTTSDF